MKFKLIYDIYIYIRIRRSGPVFYSLVVWTSAPHMSSAIHQPRKVQIHDVTQYALREEGPEPGLTPAVDGNGRWQNEAQQHFQWNKVSAEK